MHFFFLKVGNNKRRKILENENLEKKKGKEKKERIS